MLVSQANLECFFHIIPLGVTAYHRFTFLMSLSYSCTTHELPKMIVILLYFEAEVHLNNI
jgi:hypothetical protein